MKDESTGVVRTGQCHCGRAHYEWEGEPTDASFCHCSICRRLTGSAFGAWCEVPSRNLRWSSRDTLRSYRVTERLETLFCGLCGSTLAATHSKWPGYSYLLMGTLDDDDIAAPGYHQFTASKASWHEIHDSIPQYENWPEHD